ncbi:MAG: hypothetical protein K6T37_00210 [Acidothermus cellulolyticus]|jgi:DNA-binding MarR family transcriptional regulator|nr:hypothetical protein [Acidothermus cellulolyticus]
MTPSTLVRGEYVKAPSMINVAERLIARGLVLPTRQPSDQRHVLISRTRKCDGVARRIGSGSTAWFGGQID